MVERKEGRTKRKPHRAFQRVPVGCGDLCVWGEGAEGMAAERSNHHGAQESKLTLQKRCAGGDLLGCWIAVLGWATLHHIQDEYIFSCTPSKSEEKIEESSCCPYERSPNSIFAGPRGFSHEKQLGACTPLARYATGSR